MEQFLLVISITLLASMSPGPDFILVTKNNLLHGLKAGIITSIGVGLGVLVHVIYCIAGLGLIISKSILLFNIIKIAGALYLLYLAYMLMKSKKQDTNLEIKNKEIQKKSNLKFLTEGFLGNALNPKATIFFLSVFTQIIDIKTPIITQMLLGLSMMGVVGTWFILLSFLLNLKFIKNKISSIQYIVEKIMGGLLAFVGIKIILDTSN
ncbi:MAG: LysE family translocator [Candidatus Gracilibacteria bacterium]|nr:LysE family translocator [Candidatus Gracilibacteria bacterium]